MPCSSMLRRILAALNPCPIGVIMRVNKHLLMIFSRVKTVKIKHGLLAVFYNNYS